MLRLWHHGCSRSLSVYIVMSIVPGLAIHMLVTLLHYMLVCMLCVDYNVYDWVGIIFSVAKNCSGELCRG